MSLKIVFMGTPKFSLPTLEALINNKFNIIKVYTQPPKKSKRGQTINISPIEEFSKKNKLNLRNPANLNTNEEYEVFKNLSPDLVIVVAYGQIIPKKILEIAKFGFINIHASLLPRWRGAAPIQRAIMNCDKKIGVSIMKIEEKLDSGPILAMKELKLIQNDIYGEIEKKLSAKFLKQVDSEATYAKKINKTETKINWSLDSNKVLAHIHGLSPTPGAWFEYESERFKILKAKETLENGKPGTVINENLTIACKLNSIRILEIQRQGKNKQNSKDFLLGKKINKGSILI